MGKLPGSNSDRNKKWLKRIVIAIVVIFVLWLVVLGLQKWAAKKQPVAAANSNTQVISVDQNTATTGDQFNLEILTADFCHIVDPQVKYWQQVVRLYI
jgi:uncharacterized protein YpmB